MDTSIAAETSSSHLATALVSHSPSGVSWEVGPTYVVGHLRPDTDAIASALGYTWYLAETGQEEVIAARAGHPAPQTSFALERFGCMAPGLLMDVAPTFGHAAQPQPGMLAESPLAEALSRVASGRRVVPLLDDQDKPLGAVTPMAMARAFSTSARSTSMAVVSLLEQSCRSVMEVVPCFMEVVPCFQAQERISDRRSALLRTDADDFLVLDEGGRYLGVATRSRILEPPRARLILVDHNELAQAVAGVDEAEIVGVLDHHRLGNPTTAMPISFLVEPVGSTCTLVAERCLAASLVPPASLSGLMLSGILSDTLVFRSPTATKRDQAAAQWLAELSGVDVVSYGYELLRSTPGLLDREPSEIIDGDRKAYQLGGKEVSIGQVEVTDLQELSQRREELLTALEEQRQREGLALTCLMVTDVVSGRSHLLCRGEKSILAILPFAREGEGEWNLASMVSRKKQLVPALHAALVRET